MSKNIKVGEMEVPTDYWLLDEDEKKTICLNIADAILTLLDSHLSPKMDKMDILERLLESSIQSNEDDENYEVCQVLNDIKKIINE